MQSVLVTWIFSLILFSSFVKINLGFCYFILIFFSYWLQYFRKKMSHIHVWESCLNSKTPLAIQPTSMESATFPFRRRMHLTPPMIPSVKHWLLDSLDGTTLTSLWSWIMKWYKKFEDYVRLCPSIFSPAIMEILNGNWQLMGEFEIYLFSKTVLLMATVFADRY